MAKVQFQVDGLDSNTASIFNDDVTFDGNVDASSISIGGTDILEVIPPGPTYSTSAPSSPTVGQVWIDSDSSVSTYDISQYALKDSPTITMGTLTSESATTDPLTISSANAHGGAGFAGLMKLEHTGIGATNPKKFVRMNSSGGLEIVNDAYTQTIFSLADNGNLSGLGTVNGVTLQDSGWISVTSFQNSFNGYNNIAYRKLNGIVYMRGAIKDGTAGATAFNLPEGYRPEYGQVFACQRFGTTGVDYVSVDSNGNVYPNTPNAWLSTIVFPVG